MVKIIRRIPPLALALALFIATMCGACIAFFYGNIFWSIGVGSLFMTILFVFLIKNRRIENGL